MNRYLSRYCCYYPATLLKGERIKPALDSARDFQWLNAEAIRRHQFARAKAIIQHAQQHSPFYRERFKGIEVAKFNRIEDLQHLPTVSKSDLIDFHDEILTDFGGKYEVKTTGGSTGHPVKIVKNANALAMERAVTWRAYEWAGVTVGDPQGRFWGIPHTRQGRWKAKLTDLIANRKRVSAFNLNPTSLKHYYDELRSFKPSYLYGYVSVIEALADFICEHKLPPIPTVKSIITTSEILYPKSRQAIESAFGVKVFNEYGCGEVGSIAHECEHGRLHIMADNLLLEIDGEEEGEILVTDFYNYKTPLIRYRVGDYGRLAEQACPCGRGLPVLAKVYGRAYDLLTLNNGTSIHPESLIYVIEDFKAERDVISQFQAVQQDQQQIDIFVVPKTTWDDQLTEQLKDRMKNNLSAAVDYRVEVVSSIAREKSGKMRLVKNAMNGKATRPAPADRVSAG